MSLLAVVGPTGAGKSAFALDLAEALGNAEIVSADAFALYRGMTIGTATPTLAEQRGIPHHQIDVLDLHEEASVAAYQRHARADIAAIEARGNRAIVCGGSGLYVRALLDELEFPGTDPDLRARLQAWADEAGTEALHARLAALDPVSAERIPAANVRRVVRALEVCELTGRPFSATLPDFRYVRPTRQYGVTWEPELLRGRIAARSRAMVQAGLLDEVRALQAAGLEDAPTAARATGYPQALRCLSGDLAVADLADEIASETWRLAKRQLKWFRRDPRITWLDGADKAVLSAALTRECAG